MFGSSEDLAAPFGNLIHEIFKRARIASLLYHYGISPAYQEHLIRLGDILFYSAMFADLLSASCRPSEELLLASFPFFFPVRLLADSSFLSRKYKLDFFIVEFLF
jgi:hypothetical protein